MYVLSAVEAILKQQAGRCAGKVVVKIGTNEVAAANAEQPIKSTPTTTTDTAVTPTTTADTAIASSTADTTLTATSASADTAANKTVHAET